MKKLFVEPYLEIVDICSLAYTLETSNENAVDAGGGNLEGTEASEDF